ncbi:MAG: aminotransferase class III-fold pyridoxal phosphate-dependent enzyme [Actinomycetota bacterium]|nr:aminotransferase class III-fold pyridoxal phosphate-dependent enzyme [Actinomycetota bacterium]
MGTEQAQTRPAALHVRCAAAEHYIWPQLSRLQIAEGFPQLLSEGEGVRVRTVEGDEYLDLMSTVSRASALGYGEERIARAVYEQLRRLHYGGTAHSQADVTIELAERLAGLTPGQLTATVFVSSGSEANEVAFKLARFYHQARGYKPRAYKVIARWNDYHGAAGGATAASDWLGVRRPMEPTVPGFSRVPAPTSYRCPFGWSHECDESCALRCAEYLEQHILHEGPELVSAFILEPIPQANGVQIPPAGYLQRVREICRKHDVVFIADEVVTGFGRTGEWFAVDHWGIEPDIMTMAKALTAGYMPLAATIASREIRDALDGYPDIHTYGGHPGAAVAALTAIDIYEREGLRHRAAEEGAHALATLRELERLDAVGEVRGCGLWIAVDFTADRATREPLAPEVLKAIVRRTRDRGVLVSNNGTAIEIAPPLVIAREDLDEGLGAFAEAVGEIVG